MLLSLILDYPHLLLLARAFDPLLLYGTDYDPLICPNKAHATLI